MVRSPSLALDNEAVQPPQPRTFDPARVARAEAVLADGGDEASRWAARFAMLADPNRLRLLMAMHAAPDICVSDLAAVTGMSDTSVSQALRLLRSQGWVTTRREGRMVLYALDDGTVHELLHMLGAGHGAVSSS
jgi:DNA-binding transcriptional ArsR family regulator